MAWSRLWELKWGEKDAQKGTGDRIAVTYEGLIKSITIFRKMEARILTVRERSYKYGQVENKNELQGVRFQL